ncbi:NADPH-dependent F420 reductase [Dactylosporangium matsuzakiense]|uniref:NADPH-dependent F420 reductase n=1 Tax=Dactylosporangium matsuzakiense TaxID=53360 RepID=A0A9W6NNG4_9ACTN|nr:NADPH-dependent F420 reductase [Dactylosporangium matsuzakiense]UWZ43499.1 NADPH-dependent F420 reductase [Dactylosporangium matsuzakiense]GLL02997.1 NADPH-dependent F420 reductase [Dactylosporangium matsuzakiense]
MSYDQIALPDVSGLSVGILGGTGPQGRGLAYRFARAGQRVLVGSRSAERGEQAAQELRELLESGPQGNQDEASVTGGDNEHASQADIVIVAVPWDGHGATLAALAPHLRGRIVVDCVNPLGFDDKGPYPLRVEEGSAAEQAAALLPESRVCAAFHHVSAVLLADPAVAEVDLDVLVLGDDRDAALHVQALAARIAGMRGVFAGRLRNAGQIEAFTANLIAINKRYKAHAGIRVTDL